MKNLAFVLISFVVILNSSFSQWINKTDHQVLSERVSNLRDLKIYPEKNLIIGVTKFNDIFKWQYDTGKLIDSKRVKTDTNCGAFISRDGLFTIFTEYIIENDSNKIMIEMVSNEDFITNYNLKYTYKHYQNDKIKINKVEFADIDIKSRIMVLKINNFEVFVHDVLNYTIENGTKLVQINIDSKEIKINNYFPIKSNQDIINKVGSFDIYASSLRYENGNHSSTDRSYKSKDGIIFCNKNFDSIYFESVEKASYIQHVINSSDNNSIYIQSLDKRYLYIFDKKTESIKDSIYGYLYSKNPIQLTNYDKFLHQINCNEYSIYLFENLEKLYSFNLSVNSALSLPHIDEESGTVIIPTYDSLIVKLNPKILNKKSDIIVYAKQDSVLVNNYAEFVVQDTLKDVEYLWDFGDGIGKITKEKNVEYPCMKEGYLTLKLSIIKNNKTIRYIEIDSIVLVLDKLNADYEFKFLNDTFPRQVMFVNKTKGKYKDLRWYFEPNNVFNFLMGDTAYFNYKKPGNYTVKLIVSNDIDSDTLIKYEGINIDINEVNILKPKLTKKIVVSAKALLKVYKHKEGYIFSSGSLTYENNNNYFYINKYVHLDNYNFNFSSTKSFTYFNEYSISNSLEISLMDNTFEWFDNNIIAFRFAKEYEIGVGLFDIADNKLFKRIQFNGSFLPMKSINENLFLANRKAYDTLGKQAWEIKPLMNKIKQINIDSDPEKIFYGYKDTSNNVEIQIYNLSGDLLSTHQTSIYKKSSLTTFKKMKSNHIIAGGNYADETGQLYNFYLKKINLNDFSEKTFSYYNATKIVEIIEFSNNQIGVFTNNTGRNGFLLLDSNLDKIADYRIDNLTSDIVSVILSDNKLLIFSQKEVNLITSGIEEVKNYETQINEVLLPEEIISSSKDESITNHNKFVMYPNPSTDFITINLQPSGGLNPSEGLVVEIYDMLGVKVISEPIHPMTSSHRMNIEKLPAGVYFVKIGDRVEKFLKL